MRWPSKVPIGRLSGTYKIMKKLTIQSKDITPKQWSNLVLELNLVRKAWKPYAKVEILGSGIKKIVKNGTKLYKI